MMKETSPQMVKKYAAAYLSLDNAHFFITIQNLRGG